MVVHLSIRGLNLGLTIRCFFFSPFFPCIVCFITLGILQNKPSHFNTLSHTNLLCFHYSIFNATHWTFHGRAFENTGFSSHRREVKTLAIRTFDPPSHFGHKNQYYIILYEYLTNRNFRIHVYFLVQCKECYNYNMRLLYKCIMLSAILHCRNVRISQRNQASRIPLPTSRKK